MLDVENFLPRESNDSCYSQLYESLRIQLKNKNVHNIGILGDYGAGKSSFIKGFFSYCRKCHCYKKNKTLFISFIDYNDRCFKDVHAESDQPQSLTETLQAQNKLDSYIESYIIKQLLFSQPAEKFPLSKYKRISASKSRFIKSIIGFVAALTVLIKSSAISGKINLVTAAVSSAVKNDSLSLVLNKILQFNEPFITGVALILMIVFLVLGIKGLSLLLSQLKFKTGTAKTPVGEVSVEKNESKSPLDENFDELLYFFERTKINLVVFEDIDRMTNTSSVFYHLRNLNFMLNNNVKFRNHPVRFMYAIDEGLITKGEDRVKFFDFIIPIVSVMNNRNAADFLINEKNNINRKNRDKNNKVSIKEKVSCFIKNIFSKKESKTYQNKYLNLKSNYLEKIGRYISSKREAAAITNEFIMTKIQLNNKDLDDEKLFTLMVIKYLDYEEFKSLCKNRGNSIIYNSYYFSKTLKENFSNAHKDALNQQGKIYDDSKYETRDMIYKFWIRYNEKTDNSLSYEVYTRLDNIALFENVVKKCLEDKEDYIYQGETVDHDIFKETYEETEIEYYIKNHKEINDTYVSLQLNTEIKGTRIKSLITAYPEVYLEYMQEKFPERKATVLMIKSMILNGYIDKNFQSYVDRLYEIGEDPKINYSFNR